MALVVEDGSVVAGANSYATAQDAIDYFTERGITVAITDADMILAAEFIDVTYGPTYKGVLYDSENQFLLFPRSTFTDNNGRTVEAQTIPKELKEAQYHAAKLSVEGVQLVDNVDPQSQLESFTKTIEGAVSKSESYFAPVNRNQKAFIGKYIYPILDSTRIGRTVRA